MALRVLGVIIMVVRAIQVVRVITRYTGQKAHSEKVVVSKVVE